MAVILSIETSTSVCSAALHENGNLIAVKELHTPHSAAAQLIVLVDQLLMEVSVSRNSLNAVAISAGPGSYTGLRIGTATAKGICSGLRIPLVAIDSLLVLAAAVENAAPRALLCPMIDARRMEVYCCLLDSSLQILQGTHAKIIDSDSFMTELSSSYVLFFGNGAEKCKEVIRHPHAVFINSLHSSAASMGALAYQRFETGQLENLSAFEPNYLKDFVAKTKSAVKLL